MRVSKTFFGIGSSIEYNPHDMEHKRRVDCVFQCASGEVRVPKWFSVILPKVKQSLSSRLAFYIKLYSTGHPAFGGQGFSRIILKGSLHAFGTQKCEVYNTVLQWA